MAIDGFLTRSVRDTAALLDATVGPDLGAPYYAPAIDGTFSGALATPPRRLRIAVSTRSFTGGPIHPDCVAAVEHTAALCESLGHEVVPLDPTVDIERFMRAWSDVVACGTELTVRTRAASLGRPLTDDDTERVTRLACEHAAHVSGADYIAALDVIHAVGREMARFLDPAAGCPDMLLTATLGEPPATIGRFPSDRADAWGDFLDFRLNIVLPYSPFTALANGTGQPAMSLPLWWNAAGLPVGTHVMSRAGDDHTLVQLAAQLEQAAPWFAKRPPI
jgi:amidase/6-aminohexanoate-cyclic-dimer hydrolase